MGSRWDRRACGLQHGKDPTARIGIRVTDNAQVCRDAHPSRKEKRGDADRNRSFSVATESSQNALQGHSLGRLAVFRHHSTASSRNLRKLVQEGERSASQRGSPPTSHSSRPEHRFAEKQKIAT
jgi:hypothetical protein